MKTEVSLGKRVVIVGISATVVVLLLTAILTKFLLHKLAVERHVGPVHTFEVVGNPKTLTQAMALEKAREALKLDGNDPQKWQPIEDPLSYLESRGYRFASTFAGSTLDGTPEPFFSREKKRTNCGIVIFLDKGGVVRFVRVGLANSHVLCQCSGGM